MLANKNTVSVVSSRPSICVKNSFLNRFEASWSVGASRLDANPSISSTKSTDGA